MRRSLALVAALLLAGCGKLPEKEPNDDHAHATVVRPGRRVQGTVSSPSDTDVYRLEVAQDGLILGAHVGGIKDVDFVLSVQDKDRIELKRYDETSTGGDEEATDVGVRKGSYYLALSNKNPKADNPGQPYLLTVRLDTGAGREAEPNDAALWANPLPLGGALRGHYFPARGAAVLDSERGEEDWFRVDAASGPYSLNLEVSGVPRVDAVLEIYDVHSYKLKELDAAGEGEGEALRDFGLRGPARYLLRLRSKRRMAGNPDVPYELRTELLPYSGETELEPNDRRPEATPLPRGRVSGAINPRGDVDFYRLDVPTETRRVLAARLSALPGMDLQLDLLDELGHSLSHMDDQGPEQPEVLTGACVGLGRGEYYLAVSEKSGRLAEARRPYELSWTLAPFESGLECEPDDAFETAQGLKVGEAVDGHLAPKGDVDFYEFNVYRRGLASAEVTGVPNVQFALALFDQDRREVAAASSRGPGEPAGVSLILEPGTYSARLQAADPEQVNVRDKYAFRVRVQ